MTTKPLTDRRDGCCDEHRAELSRRGALKGLGVGALTAGAYAMAGPNVRMSFANGTSTDTLVVLSLRGGFDGLSAVAPVGDPYYAGLRGDQALDPATAIKLDSTFSLHGALKPLETQWRQGTFGVALDVGQEHPTRSHFQAIKEMEKAAPDTSLRTGWLDRLGGLLPSTGAFTVSQVGNTNAPQAFNGPNPEMTLSSIERFALNRASSDSETARVTAAIRGMQSGAPAMVSGPTNAALTALAQVDRIRAQSYAAPAAYPRESWGDKPLTELSRALADTARLIRAGVGLRVATIDFGNWDMHEWAGVRSGWMHDQLSQLGKALAAFIADLGPAYNDTTIITMSDFGRRIDRNGTAGFDHGHGNQMLLLGGGIRGGLLHGSWGGLAPEAQDQGALPGRNDYRSVIGSVLTNRMGLSGAQLSTVFPNRPAALIDVARRRAV